MVWVLGLAAVFIIMGWASGLVRPRCRHLWSHYQVHGDARREFGRWRRRCKRCGRDEGDNVSREAQARDLGV